MAGWLDGWLHLHFAFLHTHTPRGAEST
jgi:hypothetical protein